MVEQLVDAQGAQKNTNSTDIGLDRMIEHLNDARKKNKEYIGPFNRIEKIKASEEVGGYDQKIVALITPACISACDVFSSLLKTSRRATLIGSHTNGTGAGYFTSTPLDSIKWEDDYRILKVYIPNSLFGKARKIDKPQMSLSAAREFSSENKPTFADVKYDPVLDDYLKKGEPWFDKAISVLEGQAKSCSVKAKNAKKKSKG